MPSLLSQKPGAAVGHHAAVKSETFFLVWQNPFPHHSNLYGASREHQRQLAPRPRRMTFAVSNIIAKSRGTDTCLM